MNRWCVALLAGLPLTALAYPIDVEMVPGDTQISYSAHDIAADLASLTLVNPGENPARCTVTFNNGPEMPRIRRTLLAPGETAHLTVKLHRQVVRLRIDVECLSTARRVDE